MIPSNESNSDYYLNEFRQDLYDEHIQSCEPSPLDELWTLVQNIDTNPIQISEDYTTEVNKIKNELLNIEENFQENQHPPMNRTSTPKEKTISFSEMSITTMDLTMHAEALLKFVADNHNNSSSFQIAYDFITAKEMYEQIKLLENELQSKSP